MTERLYKITLERMFLADVEEVREAIRKAGWEPKVEFTGFLEE